MHTRRIIIAVAAAIALSACGDEPTDPTGKTAPDFSLADANPASATHGEVRTLYGRDSEVIVLYFVSFG